MRILLVLALISFSAAAGIGFKETTYERVDGDEATITITDEGGSYLTVKGSAIWVNQFGVEHSGELNNTVRVKNSVAFYKSDACKLKFTFTNKELIISGDDGYCGGLNVRFNGNYKLTNQEGINYSKIKWTPLSRQTMP